jgi:hypothetical protein
LELYSFQASPSRLEIRLDKLSGSVQQSLWRPSPLPNSIHGFPHPHLPAAFGPSLDDLVGFDEEFKAAFEAALGDVVDVTIEISSPVS